MIVVTTSSQEQQNWNKELGRDTNEKCCDTENSFSALENVEKEFLLLKLTLSESFRQVSLFIFFSLFVSWYQEEIKIYHHSVLLLLSAFTYREFKIQTFHFSLGEFSRENMSRGNASPFTFKAFIFRSFHMIWC